MSACSVESDKPFRVGTNIWPGYEPLYLARSLGQYEGTNIRLIELLNASEVIQALRNGSLEAATLTLDEALTIVQDGYDLRAVLVMDFSRGGDVLLGTEDIENLSAVRGRRIGVENTAVGAILLDAALREAGVKIQEVTLIALTVDEHEQAFRSGVVDAVVTFEPVRSRLLASGARLLYDSNRIPDRIVDVLVVPAEVAARQSDTLFRLLKGYFAALTHLRNKPEDAARRMAPRMGLHENDVLKVYTAMYQPDLSENHRLLEGDPSPVSLSARRLASLMLERGMLQREPRIEYLFSNHWLPPIQ